MIVLYNKNVFSLGYSTGRSILHKMANLNSNCGRHVLIGTARFQW